MRPPRLRAAQVIVVRDEGPCVSDGGPWARCLADDEPFRFTIERAGDRAGQRVLLRAWRSASLAKRSRSLVDRMGSMKHQVIFAARSLAGSELQKTLSYPSLQCLMRKHDAGPQAAAGTVAERQLAAVRLHNGMGDS